MDELIKKKVLDWINVKIGDGFTQFRIDDCIMDLGMNPLNIRDIDSIEEIFLWHKTLINEMYDICLEINT